MILSNRIEILRPYRTDATQMDSSRTRKDVKVAPL